MSTGRGRPGRPKPSGAKRPQAGARPSARPTPSRVVTGEQGRGGAATDRGTAARTARADAATGPEEVTSERLQKVLAAAGIGSRRQCEELITTGRVEVDRQTVTELGTKVDPASQEIRVDGERLPSPKRVVYLLNKPVGVVTTNYDPSGRSRVIDLIPADRRLFAVGRLDRMSEGLILVTNDGDLANRLTHPRFGVEKTYLVQVAGVPTQETLDTLRRGMHIAEGRVQAKRVVLKSSHKASAVLEMVLDEGRNREVRRMLAACGHKVQQLKRVAVGPLSLGQLLPGQYRLLTWAEIRALEAAGPSHLEAAEARPRRAAGSGTGSRGVRTSSSGRGSDGRRADGRSGGRPGGMTGGSRPGKDARPLAKIAKPRRRPGKASSWRAAKGERRP